MTRFSARLPRVSVSASSSSAAMSGCRPVALADDLHPDAVLVQFGEIAADEQLQQAHQVADLGLRPRPVLRREGVDGQPGDADVAGARAPSCAAPRRRRDGRPARGRPRAFAQRPLPSMMIATCAGVVICSAFGRRRRETGLNLHDFGFLAGKQAVDRRNRLVGQLLHLVGLACDARPR